MRTDASVYVEHETNQGRRIAFIRVTNSGSHDIKLAHGRSACNFARTFECLSISGWILKRSSSVANEETRTRPSNYVEALWVCFAA
jgi:hypothetical protein